MRHTLTTRFVTILTIVLLGAAAAFAALANATSVHHGPQPEAPVESTADPAG
ncbi:MAG TPA: hypothetical protein VM307_11550 [Egibacteraceae bacterium]|nr:hypothetical protein [Egibacteraceae bacterium]